MTLILLVAGGALLGALLVQAPDRVLSDPAAYRAWLEQIRPRYGALTDLFASMSLFDVFRSVWFRALALALTANVVVCTARRWPGIWRASFQPPAQPSAASFAQASQHAEALSPAAPAAAAASLQAALATQRYRVRLTSGGEDTWLSADRNHLARLGTVLNHAGLVLILVGALVSSLFGFRDEQFFIAEGKTRPVGHDTELTARLDDFSDEYYPSGAPRDYRSDLVLLKGGQEVTRQAVRVNEPLSYEGVTFYQASFGNALDLEVSDGQGQVLYSDVVPLAMSFQGFSAGAFEVPERQLTVVAVWTAGAGEGAPDITLLGYRQPDFESAFAGPLWQGDQGASLDGLTFRFPGVRQYSVLQVARDPGANLIWLASALMMLGIVAALYFPHQRLWARVTPTETGSRLDC